MGEMADDILDGACCDTCGEYFEESYGYPVTCNACWKEMTKKEREAHQHEPNEVIGEG